MIDKNDKKFPEWKVKNKEYLREIQIFLDKADNIENEKLRNDIIYQMLKCDKTITKIAQEKIDELKKLEIKEKSINKKNR